MFWNVLLDAAEGGATEPAGGNNIVMPIILVGLIVLAFVFMFFSGRKGKAQQEDYQEQLSVLAPGHKVRTIGGVCGVVVEVCDDDTVVIESGTDTAGKSYLKVDKLSIAQTDAKGPKQLAREEAEAKKKAEKEAKKAAPTEDKKETEE
ncbi:MAG: preprotein translocase subunit YajC [Clostridia bacterium]|nr:preprotein translocase subunit YajC [Clostridia bacterium]